jgi:hypothetical protein
MTSADRSLAKMDNTNILNAFIIQQNQQWAQSGELK